MINVIQKAETLVMTAQYDQRRKYTNERYYHHPLRVAGALKLLNYNDTVLVAALLHDIVEDTDYTSEDIYDLFGPEIGKLVSEVTDVSKPSDGNRSERKALDMIHLGEASSEGKSIKLADIIDNLPSVIKYDPEFAKIYVFEKQASLLFLEGGAPVLYDTVSNIIKEYYTGIKEYNYDLEL